MKCLCSKCKKEFVTHQKLKPRPFLISKKQWAKLRLGSILKSPNGTLRKNLSRKSPVVFYKLRGSQYPANTTVYGYNDLCHDYTIVKF